MSHDPITAGLNDSQRQAVEQIDGPMLILAGAGSGKTKTLTHRIAFLLQQDIKPWTILAVTFTNKAAGEMKERLTKMLKKEGSNTDLPAMGTFHSICVRILRSDFHHIGRENSFTIYDSDDQLKLLKQIHKALNITEQDLKPRVTKSAIGRFKCEALMPKEVLQQASQDRSRKIAQVYQEYQKELLKANAVDFDDILLETVRLFHECPEVLQKYQNRWKYIHVDEYQDTNHTQYLMLKLLADKHHNLFVIGDPDQSIYSFRGADIRNILEFKKEYKDVLEIKLEQNYRSTQLILSASNDVIKHNPGRPAKEMWSERKEGPNIIIQDTADGKSEAQTALKIIKDQQAEGVSLSNQVILYRTNAQSRLLEEACMRNAVPYRLVGGVRFYARKEVKDVLAYLQIVINPFDSIALQRIINVPSRKIGATTIAKVQDAANLHGYTLWDMINHSAHLTTINQPTIQRLIAFQSLVKKWQLNSVKKVVSALTKEIIDDTGLEKYINDGTPEGATRWENILELLTVMQKYDALEPEVALRSFLEEVALVSDLDNINEDSDVLTLMTLHLCKGLEWEHVVITGCEEGLLPHASSSFDPSQLEEERRLMYVGMTRAKTNLSLLRARMRAQWGDIATNAASRFLSDISEKYVENRSDEVLSAFSWAASSGEKIANSSGRRGTKLEAFSQQHSSDDDDDNFNQDQDQEPAEGMRIRHPGWGDGTITAVRGDVVDVQFDRGLVKTLALSIAPIEIIG